jgi:hypothetical protein
MHFDGHIPRYRTLCDSRSLLARSIRLRVISAPGGVTRPIDERNGDRGEASRLLPSHTLENHTPGLDVGGVSPTL